MDNSNINNNNYINNSNINSNNNISNNMNNKCDTHGGNCDGGCIDPNVDNGMMTKVWGPPGWLFLHCVSFGYPYAINHSNPAHKNKKLHYGEFFNNVGNILPCKYCRESYIDFIKENPVENNLDTREQLCKWLYDIHNKVNHKLGVPDCKIPSFEEVKVEYEKFRAKCKKTDNDERENNMAKGCVTPADGTKKRCVVKVVECSSGDVTRRDNAAYDDKAETSDDFILITKDRFYAFWVVLLFFILFIGYLIYKNKKIISKLKI